jgi:hypothetical protein
METQYSLVSIFEENKQELKERLLGKSFPKDAKEVQDVVNAYFEEILGKENLFRQRLKPSEEYILNAAMSLLNAQQSMYGDIIQQEIKGMESVEYYPESDDLIPIEESKKNIVEGTGIGIGASALGVGAYALGASVYGGLIVTVTTVAIGLYVVSKLNDKRRFQIQREEPTSEFFLLDKKLDVDKFISIICNICKQIDELMNTYRVQIAQVRNSYKSKEEISLEKDFKLLLSSIQMMLGISYEEDASEKCLKKLKERVEEVGESLENYGIKVIKYSDEVKAAFEIVRRENIEQPKTLIPALEKDGTIVLRGKVAVRK